jgi:hypothetical protein
MMEETFRRRSSGRSAAFGIPASLGAQSNLGAAFGLDRSIRVQQDMGNGTNGGPINDVTIVTLTFTSTKTEAS